MIRTLLCVCHANVGRSPTAEGILRVVLPHLAVDSAGTHCATPNRPPHPTVQSIALRHGYDLSGLRARQVTAADLATADLVLALDAAVQADLAPMMPRHGQGQLCLLGDSIGSGPVPDPYETGDFEAAFAAIHAAAEGWAARLGPPPP